MSRDMAPVRGTKDYLPREMAMREEVKSIILKSYKSFGFLQIGTPILENIDNLLGSDGGENLKLIFKVLKRGEKLNLSQPNLTERDIVDIGLKYDQTVPLARLYANNQNVLPSPFKSIQIDSSFRADRPQLGRNRQFTQCDIDILGDPSSNAEIDIINTTAKTFEALGFDNIVAKVNDRRILSSLIKSAGFDEREEKEVCVCLDKMDKLGVDGVCTEMQNRGFDLAKIQFLMRQIAAVIEAGRDFPRALLSCGVAAELIQNMQYVLDSVNALSSGKFSAVFDLTIVRGQNYYTGLVYEFFLPGISGACAGGGRYDQMIGKMLGQTVPAVGLGLGFEPTCILYSEKHRDSVPAVPTIAVLYHKAEDFVEVMKFVQSINSSRNAAAILAKKNVSHQLDILRENGYTHFCNFSDADKEIREIARN